ncbi:MAG: isoprenylcysteine carboxylmethyltransferase family protein [Actinomycetota bacterium]|nr:isoprenylcysteine carboxylmethyltransferase family protein [Actinomycetota bacterium]
MAGLALALMVFFLVLAFGVRVAVALKTTGSSGISSLRVAPTAELVGGGMFALATVLGAANPALALADAIPIWDELDTTAAHAAGTILCLAGILGTFVAQMAMGSSWRIGVDPSERTELVTGGIFASMRNPIYTFMIVTWTGFALLVPTWVALAAGVLLVAGIQIQVRAVEEPHMIRTHGETYLEWACRVGRFVPGIGRLRPAPGGTRASRP